MPAGGYRKIRHRKGGEPSLINLYGTRDGTNPRCSSLASTHASTNKVELTADVTTRPHI